MAFQLLFPAAASVFMAPEANLATLQVNIAGARNPQGAIHLCLTTRERSFPDCSKDDRAVKISVPASSRSVQLTGIVPGRYALTLFHDQNNNRRLDTMLGIPREGFGFSRNPVVRFGAPKFKQVVVQLVSGNNSQGIRLQYLL